MTIINFTYDDCPTVAAWSLDREPMLRGLLGPFGSGKSSGCIMELLNLANLQAPQQDGIKRARFAIIRNTYVELKDTTIRTVLEWMPEPEFGKFHWTDHNYPVIGIPGIEMELMFRALDRPAQVKNLLSLELTAAWVNEAKEIPWAIIEALTGRVGRYPSRNRGGCNYPCIIMDTNPPDDSTWWYKKFEEERGTPAYQDRVLYKQPSGLSPDAENVRNLPPRYYERLASNMSTEAAKVYVHGEYGFLVDGKPVYGDYVDSIHCTEFADPTRVDRLYRGWDFGLTPACVLSALVEGQWRTFHEFVADGSASLDFRTFAEGVLDEQARLYPWIAANKIPIDDIGDPSGVARSAASAASDEASCFDIAAGLGISMQGGDQSLKLRIDSVAYPLKQIRAGKPLLLIHPRCKMLRRGYQGKYQYRRLKVAGIDNRYHELPDKNEYSHVHDANQYIAARLFSGLLKSQDERNKDWKRPVKYPKLSIK